MILLLRIRFLHSLNNEIEITTAPIKPKNVSIEASLIDWIVDDTTAILCSHAPEINDTRDEYKRWHVCGIRVISSIILEQNKFNACPKF